MSTRASIGATINGIQPKPTAVVVHFFVETGSLVNLFKENKVKAHILLIVNPKKERK